MSKKHTRPKAVIAALAARFPKCFAVADTHRRPLKVGIDADLLAALGDDIPRTELIRGLAMYCNSNGYLEQVRAGASRVDLAGEPAGVVTADDEKHAKAKRAAIRARQDTGTQTAKRAKEDTGTQAAKRAKEDTGTQAAKRAKEDTGTQAAKRAKEEPAPAPKAEPAPGPKRLSLADLREAALRRRKGPP